MRGPRRLGRGGPALACLLLVVACQSSAAQPAPRPSAPAAAVQAADDRFYRGDYDGAESDYRALARSGAPGALSHLALLLAYESRFAESVSQAEAAAAEHPDSATLARLTRALDWSENLNSALAAGARAVAAKPVDPLAPIFYSEALADSGFFDESTRQLKAAQALKPQDAYTRSELNREWANLYRDKKNAQQELNYVQLSLKDQPGFPERRLEVARYQYVHSKPELARAALAEVQKSFSKSYPVLVAAGDSALLGADVELATSLYQAARTLRPEGATAALGLAEIDVAVKRDFQAAHDVLLAALKQDPGAGDVYLYLRYLDQLVLHTDADAELKPIAPQAPAQLDAARKIALEKVNGYRVPLGLPPVAADPAMAEGAEAHAYFFLFNYGQAQLGGLGIHTEDAALPGFTGQNSLLRSRHFGYAGNRGAEVINHVFTPQANVQSWIDSVYHRYPLLDHETRALGYGEAKVGIISISVMDFGLAGPTPGSSIVFPAPGQKDVPGGFVGNELPDPVPQAGAYPTGYPVTLQVGGADRLAVTTGRLLSADAKEVPSYTLAPGTSSLGPNEWALLAHDPLTPGATYTAEVIGQLNGQDFSKRWSFTVTGR